MVNDKDGDGLRKWPAAAFAVYLAARNELLARNPENTLELLDPMIELFGDLALLRYPASLAEYQLGHEMMGQQQLIAARDCIDLNDMSWQFAFTKEVIRELLIRSLDDNQALSKLTAPCQELIRLHPGDINWVAELKFWHGRVLSAMGLHESAIQEFEAAADALEVGEDPATVDLRCENAVHQFAAMAQYEGTVAGELAGLKAYIIEESIEGSLIEELYELARDGKQKSRKFKQIIRRIAQR